MYYLCLTPSCARPIQELSAFLKGNLMSESSRQRLLVMNGQRLLQTSQAGGWVTSKVDKAGALKPGIYDLHLAQAADKSRAYEGPLLFADSVNVYQKAGKEVIKHKRDDFASLPAPGAEISVRYDGGKALVEPTTTKLVRGRLR